MYILPAREQQEERNKEGKTPKSTPHTVHTYIHPQTNTLSSSSSIPLSIPEYRY